MHFSKKLLYLVVLFLVSLIGVYLYRHLYVRYFLILNKNDFYTVFGFAIAISGSLLGFYQLYLQIRANETSEEKENNRQIWDEINKARREFDERCDVIDVKIEKIQYRITDLAIGIKSHENLPGHRLLMEEIGGIYQEVAAIRAKFEYLSHFLEVQKRVALMEVLLSRLDDKRENENI